MRLGLAQINTIVGDLTGNRQRILGAYRSLVSQGAELIVFPELVVCGYPPRDLLFKSRFIADVEQTTREIAVEIGAVPAIIGYIEANTTGQGRPAFNSAAFCHSGKILVSARKCLLPTYDVFDEDRYFEPAAAPTVVEFAGKRIGITICEDIWTHAMISTRRLYNGVDPVAQLAGRCDVMVNLSASPWNHGKGDVRHTLVSDTARRIGCPVVYVNAIGGNDELLFDGRSIVADTQGRIVGGLAAFREEVRMIDLADHSSDPKAGYRAPSFEQEDLADVYDALVLGVRDYAQKTGFKKALLGLSGGIDSALTAVIAAEALGPQNVIGISLPSVISSQHSKDDARILAQNLGMEYHTITIAETVAAAEQTLAPIFAGRPRACCSWRFRINLAPCCSPPATRANWPSGTARSTATCAVGSRLFPMCSRPKSTRCRAGSTVTKKLFLLLALRKHRALSCGPTKPTRIACRPTICSTRF